MSPFAKRSRQAAACARDGAGLDSQSRIPESHDAAVRQNGVEDYGFKIIADSRSMEAVLADLRGQMSDVLNHGLAASVKSGEGLKQAENGCVTLVQLRTKQGLGAEQEVIAFLRFYPAS